MKISILETRSNKVLEQQELSWKELKSLFEKHDSRYSEKTDVPMFSPAEFKPGEPRSNTSALRVHFGVIDLDDVTQEQLENVTQKLQSISNISYTSWSHNKIKEIDNQYRVRFLFELSRPVEKSEWPNFWNRLNLFFDEIPDKQCKDIQRGYYFPAYVKHEGHWIKHIEGDYFDVDSLMQKNIKEFTNKKLSWEHLRKLAEKLKKKRSEYHKDFAEILKKAAEGKSFAEHGERDSVLFKLANLIVEEYPDCDPTWAANLFFKSFAAMQEEGSKKSTFDNFRNKISRAKEKQIAETEYQDFQDQSEFAQKIRIAFGSKLNRSHPYSGEELQQFANEAKCSIDDFNKRWIIHNSGTYYIFFDGAYLPPIGEKDLINTADLYLAPAISAGINTTKSSANGKVTAKSITELLIDYGSPCFNIEADFTAQKSIYIESSKTFIEATAPLRVTEGQFDPIVDKYLSLLGGDQIEKLLDFIASLTDLTRPSVALYLHSDAGYGKSVLFNGLARLWVKGAPTKLIQGMGEAFTDSLSRCPLVVADEIMPNSFRKSGNTGELREFIQATTRQLKRKYKVEMQLKGCIRLILAANNADMLGTHEDLTQEDINAIAGRFLYINCGNSQVKQYLEGLGWDIVSSFIDNDRIAKHAVWLCENRVIKNKSRFIISTENSQFHRKMAIGTGLPSSICHWLISYLQHPQKIDLNNTGLIMVKGGELYVTSKALNDYWDMYDTHQQPQTPSKISKALVRICTKEKSNRRINGKQVLFWQVDFDNLVAWAEFNNYSSKEELLELVAKDTDLKENPLQKSSILDSLLRGDIA